MSKRCQGCGRFMALTDIIPDSDEFDSELAIECGFDENEDTRFDEKWSRFVYINDQWECDNCHTTQPNEDGKRYYWNPHSRNYDGEKPLTPKEQALLDEQAQEAAGQLRLF